MGRIAAPYGVKGWFRVQPLTEAPDGLLAYRRWWIGSDEHWQPFDVAEARVHGRGAIVARVAGCEAREAAAGFRGRDVAVPRSALPPARPGEYYWADLLGLEVVNRQGRTLGSVTRILQTGANDVLVVQGERERLVPFVDGVIGEIDAAGGTLRVDWDADY